VQQDATIQDIKELGYEDMACVQVILNRGLRQNVVLRVTSRRVAQ
jgi:hypothetical protein